MAGLKRITDLEAAATILGDELIEVSQVSTTVVLSGTTISALASDNSYNDSAAGFVAAGFAVGDRVRVSGFTGNIVNNILAGVVTAVTSSKLTIGGVDGDVIVDDAAGETVTIVKWTSKRVPVDDLPSSGGSGPVTESIIIAVGDETTALASGAGKVTFRMPYALTLTEVRASLKTAQASGSILTVDINEGGSSVLSTKLTIDNTEKTSVTATAAAVISDVNLADDAEITIDIDQIGDGTAVGLKVVLIGEQP